MPERVRTAWNKAGDWFQLGSYELGLCCGILCVVCAWVLSAICLEGYSWRLALGAAVGLLVYLGLRRYSVTTWGATKSEEVKTAWPWVFGGVVTVSGLLCNLGNPGWHWIEISGQSLCLGLEIALLCIQESRESVQKQIAWMNTAYLKKMPKELQGDWEQHLKRCGIQFEQFREVTVWVVTSVCTLCAMVRGVFAMSPLAVWMVWVFARYFCIGVFGGMDSHVQKWPNKERYEKRLRIRSRAMGVYLTGVGVVYMLGSFMHGLFRYSEEDVVFTTGFCVFLVLNLLWVAFVLRARSVDVLSGIDQHGWGVLLTIAGIGILGILVSLQISVLGMVRLIWQEWMVAWVFSVFVLPIGMLTNAITSVGLKEV